MKTIGKKPDSTQICSKTTLNITVMILCEISTERSRGEQRRLLYRYDRGFIHGCDSRFTLIKENETVFLHLVNLTSEDSGNYTCECGFRGGLYVLHLSVTVRGKNIFYLYPHRRFKVDVWNCVNTFFSVIHGLRSSFPPAAD